MTTSGSVTGWLDGLRAGDPLVAQRLWESYFDRLVRFARLKLLGKPRTLDDPEDVALSAFNSFFAAAQQGRFPKLDDRNDLWQILVMMTDRKASDAVRWEQAKKRPALASCPDGDSTSDRGVEQIIAAEPTPAFAAEIAEQCRWLLSQLDDDLVQIALLKLQGYTNEEIAGQITRSRATVERKLQFIRQTWEDLASRG